MNKKKIVILILLFVAVAGFTLAPASAASKTINVKDSYKASVKNIGNGDQVVVGYMSKYSGQSGKSRNLEIGLFSKYEYGKGLYYKMNKATVTYKNKGKTFTKNYKPNKYGGVNKIVPRGWTPKKVKVFYLKKSKPTLVKTVKVNNWYTSVSLGKGEVITLTDESVWKQNNVLKRNTIIQLVNTKYGGTKYYKLQKVEVTYKDMGNNYNFFETYKPKTYKIGKGFQYMIDVYHNPNCKATKILFFYSKL